HGATDSAGGRARAAPPGRRRQGLGLPRLTSSHVRMVSKRERIPASVKYDSAVRRDDEVTIAIGHSAPRSASSSSMAPRVNAKPAATVALRRATEALLIAGSGKFSP